MAHSYRACVVDAIERLKKEPGWLAGGGAEKGVVTHSSGG